jgi:hypothetical protein
MLRNTQYNMEKRKLSVICDPIGTVFTEYYMVVLKVTTPENGTSISVNLIQKKNVNELKIMSE